MKIFNTKKPILNLQGEQMKDGDDLATMGMALANLLTGNNVDSPSRGYQLGMKFYKNVTVELKAEDVQYVKGQLEKCKYLPALVIGQITEELDNKE